ncbi:hypothetical protein [Cellulomonas alba]|uniref:Uncharacterized protein n=1 Tax=Cellulomonas alba TaxID=3053467 RepID=A0ABT7SBX1_9CELL|nr:hypothetical protein [Cellulomonas alba]MDM7853683.1 hypothetical protein [Cellulomonas alba]
MGEDDSWVVRVTDEDIRAAKADWERARDAGADPRRVAGLHDDLRRLVGAQAQQLADEFRRRRAG